LDQPNTGFSSCPVNSRIVSPRFDNVVSGETEMLRPAELRALTVILEYAERGELIPNLDQFAKEVGISAKSRASGLVTILEREGYIKCDRTAIGKVQTRSIRLADIQPARPVPVLGRVAAGQPLLANREDIIVFVPLPSQYVREKRVYMLQVRGESMIGDGILDGDYVIVTPDPKPQSGAIAVVLIGDEATIKHIEYEDESIRLKSSNPAVPDQVYRESDRLIIQGRVIGVVRWSISRANNFIT
jgi:repressor LexA